MFVITTNGRVITGWRAWLIGFGAFAIATLLFTVLAFLVMGVAITMGLVMLIAIPVAVVIGLVGWLFGKRPYGM